MIFLIKTVLCMYVRTYICVYHLWDMYVFLLINVKTIVPEINTYMETVDYYGDNFRYAPLLKAHFKKYFYNIRT